MAFRDLLVIVVCAAVLPIMGGHPVFAQATTSAPAAGQPSGGATSPDTSAPAQTPSTDAPLTPEMLDADPALELVEVSLGDWSLKNEIADDLGVKVSQVPLTVSVSPEIASKVCPISSDDLEQQQVVSPTRTCAAKAMSDGLRDEVQKHLRSTDG